MTHLYCHVREKGGRLFHFINTWRLAVTLGIHKEIVLSKWTLNSVTRSENMTFDGD
jgi:hypothetical protein